MSTFIISGKRYNTDTSDFIAERQCYNNGNYSGSDYLRRTPKGVLWIESTSNGQNLYRENSARLFETNDDFLNGDFLDDEINRLLAAGLVTDA